MTDEELDEIEFMYKNQYFDSSFIYSARDYLPALIAEIRILKEIIDDWTRATRGE